MKMTYINNSKKMSFLNKRKGIIFDLDNTLIPTTTCYENVMQELPKIITEKYNISTDISNKIIKTFHILSSTEEPFWKQNSLNFWEWREDLLSKAVKRNTDVSIDVSQLSQSFNVIFFQGVKFSDKLKYLLQDLRNEYKLCILTNGDTLLQRRKLEVCDAYKYFDAAIVSFEHEMMKPDPRIFHIACRKLGLENHQCVMVGDLLGTDIIGSQRAGLKGSMLVRGGKDYHLLGKIKPDHVLQSVLDLDKALDKYEW